MSASTDRDRLTLDVQPDAARYASDLEELRWALSSAPRRIPSKYFYDRHGSALFEQITRLPEYYPTRAESSLLEIVADDISRLTRAEELVELGAGAATKTRILLDALERRGRLRLYVPFDVSESEVRRVAEELVREYPHLRVHGIVADFVHHLSAIPPGVPRLVILLGSTIGNFSPGEAIEFLCRISARMETGDFFLLGADLIKPIDIIERAYNDSAGVTAQFNRNILRVVNRVAGADFDPEAFEHLAMYNRDSRRIEMYLVALTRHEVRLESLDERLHLREGERILTEISCKYDRPAIEEMMAASGFELQEWFVGRPALFALALARKRRDVPAAGTGLGASPSR